MHTYHIIRWQQLYHHSYDDGMQFICSNVMCKTKMNNTKAHINNIHAVTGQLCWSVTQKLVDTDRWGTEDKRLKNHLKRSSSSTAISESLFATISIISFMILLSISCVSFVRCSSATK